jgi:hypothetical protein
MLSFITALSVTVMIVFPTMGQDLSLPDSLQTLPQRIQGINDQINANQFIFKDPDYQQPSQNFASGDQVYIRVVTKAQATKESICRLLDTDHTEVLSQKLELSEDSQGFVYKTTFTTPQVPGTYYVDISLTGEGLSLKSQHNITVANSSDDYQAAVITTTQRIPTITITDTTSITPPTELLPTERPLSSTKPAGFWLTLNQWFKNILIGLTNWLK